MNVYEEVCLAGIYITQKSVLVGLQVKSLSKVQNWSSSSNLMFGNLLCISIGGDFKNLFWATVEDKSRMQTEGVTVIKPLTEWNEITLTQFFSKMNSVDKGRHN